MSTHDLDPGGLRGVAATTESALEPLETHRTSASTAVDESVGSSKSPEIEAALINVWNLLLAPQYEGVEQRLAAMVAGLKNAASHYEKGHEDMVTDAVNSTDAEVDLEITDGKQPGTGE